MGTPVMSDGSRSGVHCSRFMPMSSERARARASIVLPVPGTSSSSTWPRQSSATTASSITGRLPMITFSMFAISDSIACMMDSI